MLLDAAGVQVEDDVARLSASGRVDRRAFGLRLDLPVVGSLLPTHLDLTITVCAVRSAGA